MRVLLDVSMPGLCTQLQTHHTYHIYSLLTDATGKSLNVATFATLRSSLRGSLRHHFQTTSPHGWVHLTSSVRLLSSWVRAFFSPVSQLGVWVLFSRHLRFNISSPTLRPNFSIGLASAATFVRHLLFVALPGKHITLLLSRRL